MGIHRLAPKSLVWRIILLMSLALLPLGLISVYQTRVVVKEAEALSKAVLLSETVEAAARERELIQQALGATQGLAAVVADLDEQACSETMRRFVDRQGLYLFAGFARVNGQMACVSSGEPLDFSESATFARSVANPRPRISVNQSGAATGQPVVIVSQPAYDTDRLVGIVSVSMPVRVASALLEDTGREDGFRMALINIEGEVIAGSGGAESVDAFLPQDISTASLAIRTRQSFAAVSGNGEDRYFAVASLIDDSLVLVGSWPVNRIKGEDNTMRARVAVFFPVLMWIAGLGVAVFGLQRLVVRHVKRLRSAMRQFALGDGRYDMLRLEDPPEEFADAQRAFNRMALIISEAELRREEDLRDKEVLLREVHHRVKNNLQLIASIMNMQTRNAKSAEARHMLAGLQRRVRGLAMLHRTLYTTPDLTTIDAAELIQAVIDDVSVGSANGKYKVEAKLQSIALYPDQAVPLSMFVAEALTNAIDHSGPATPESPSVVVEMTEEDDHQVRLSIFNSIAASTDVSEEEEIGEGLGDRLMTAFSRQLDGDIHVEQSDLDYQLTLTFTRRDFDPQDGPDAAAKA